MKNKIAIITALSGNKSKLPIPTVIHNNADYFAFVDEVNDDDDNSIWKQIKIFPFTCDLKFTNRRNAKPYKIMPELFVTGYDYYFWVDATHDVIENPDKIIDTYLANSLISVFKHTNRKCAFEEANEILRLGYDDTINIINQTKEYIKHNFPQSYGLYELPVIVRKASFKTTIFNMMWWEQICRYSSRDQISFPFCLWKSGIDFSVMSGYANGINPKTNTIGYNDLIPQKRHKYQM